MNKSVLGILFLILISNVWPSQSNALGVGIQVYQPLGLTFKYWTLKDQAVRGVFGYSLGIERLSAVADYMYHFQDPFRMGRPHLHLHMGAGLRVRFDHQSTIGFRFPVGAGYRFLNVIEGYFDLVPIAYLVTSTNLRLEYGIGFLYYF